MSRPPIQSRSRGIVPLVALAFIGYMLWTQIEQFRAGEACRDASEAAAACAGPSPWAIAITALAALAIVFLIVRAWLAARR